MNTIDLTDFRAERAYARNRAVTCPQCGLVWAHHDVPGWAIAHYPGPTACPECGVESLFDAGRGRRLVTEADRVWLDYLARPDAYEPPSARDIRRWQEGMLVRPPRPKPPAAEAATPAPPRRGWWPWSRPRRPRPEEEGMDRG